MKREDSSLKIQSNTPAETRALATRLAPLLQPSLLLTLRGDLGAGKTTFTQGLAEGLGIRQPVTSPTFTLINEYRTQHGCRLVHVDGYRLLKFQATSSNQTMSDQTMPDQTMPDQTSDEAMTIGIEDALADETAIVIVEWPEALADYLPTERIAVDLAYGESEQTRILTLTACGETENEILYAFGETEQILWRI